MILALTMVMLGQAAEPAPEAAPAPAAEAPPAAVPAAPAPKMNVDQLSRQLEKMKKMSPDEMGKAAEDLGKRLPQYAPEDAKKAAALMGNPVIPEVKDYTALPEVDQVRYSAREFFTQIIAGDARNITNSCGFPFQMEERRLQTPDEVFQEWLRNLRAKRTDLLTLYDIEVLSPADMEKKYGKPPARLQNLPWRGAQTYVAVANLSGHAAVAVFRRNGVGWAVVGYAD